MVCNKICDHLAKEIGCGLPMADSTIWHPHPVWFVDGNPIVGYSKQNAGVPLERVFRLLASTSMKTTEKHCVPWVQERQRQPEQDVRRAWGEEGTKRARKTKNCNK